MNDDSEGQLWRRYCWEFLSGFYCAWTYSVSLKFGVGKWKWNVDQRYINKTLGIQETL